MNPELISQLVIALPVLLFSIVVHEVAHGVAALRLGDDTAYLQGRLTLNPLPHIDPVFSLVVPAMCILSGAPVFGGARPVPVDVRRLRHPKRDMALIAAAGPLSNILLVALASLVWHGLAGMDMLGRETVEILRYFVMINVVLAAFNMLPLPPLDGSRIFVLFLSGEAEWRYRSLERWGIFLVFGVIIFFGGALGSYLSWFYNLVTGVFF
ncbi:MAG: site-2 protease family protein [Candidatus Delongbacteria bacterium]|nr:site-2 protease family protein [Candidatus Cloacimonadota bacterium]MCB9474008.1 site-2 protease family protein [Candidatus Delongbacteria bacterium]